MSLRAAPEVRVNTPEAPRLRVAEVMPASQLAPEHVHTWLRVVRDRPALGSPFFRPEFVQAVGRLRYDARVAVLEQEGKVAGFFPYQARGRTAGPIGGALSDYHGPVVPAGAHLDTAALLRACGLSSFDFDHLPAALEELAPFHHELSRSHVVQLPQGFEAYARERKARGSRRVSDALRHERQLAREVGPLRFEAATRERDVLEKLVAWKSEQYRRTGAVDVFSYRWTVELLEQLLEHRCEGFHGMLSALWAGDHFVAAHFGMRSHGEWHWWFPAYDTAHSRYSPGTVLFIHMLRSMQDLGVGTLDFGKGESSWKQGFSTSSVTLAEGCLTASALSRWSRQAWRSARDAIRSSRLHGMARRVNRLVAPVRTWMSYRP